MFKSSWIEVSRSALDQNLELIRKVLKGKTELCSVIKGNGYGHGAQQMLEMLQDAGVSRFAVFNSGEAWEIYKDIRPGNRLVIMGDVDGEALEWAIREGIEFYVFGLGRMLRAIELARKYETTAHIHLEVETGMNRTGFSLNQLRNAFALVQQHPEIKLEGLCTHFAGAESIANYYRVKEQIRTYRSAVSALQQYDIPQPLFHTSCSAGILRYPQMNQDMARVGILQYGLWPSPETRIEFMTKSKMDADPLKRVISWKSRVMNVKEVGQGEFIGYGTSFQAAFPMRIAVIPVGYSHGYRRDLSNQGFVLIHGQRARVVGTINMNALSADITGIPDVSPGTEVTLIGYDKEEEITVASFSELSKQLNYEMLTRLPADIPRKIVE